MGPVAGTGWTTADYALVISLFSATLSLAGFVWNVWSKFIFPKPRIRMAGRLCVNLPEHDVIFSFDDGEHLPKEFENSRIEYPACLLEITNFGPGYVSILEVFGRTSRRVFRKEVVSRFSLYCTYPPEPGSSGANRWITYGAIQQTKLDVGETLKLFFPVTPSMFKRLLMEEIVVRDGFQRIHCVNKSELRSLQRLVEKHVTDPIDHSP